MVEGVQEEDLEDRINMEKDSNIEDVVFQLKKSFKVP